jgi:hypothetical protein
MFIKNRSFDFSRGIQTHLQIPQEANAFGKQEREREREREREG